MVFILLVGSKLILRYSGTVIGVGEISAMLNYGMQILIQLMMLSMVYVMLTMSGESIKRISEVLDEQSSLSEPENPVFEVKDGSVDFDGVSFSYSEGAERYALSDINLHIKSGMTVGILGGTGSSKSSLVQLIPRLYDATAGTVSVGGVDVRKYDLDTLRGQVAMVLQKNVLFSGTIADNLRFGNPDAEYSDIEEAAKHAQADKFISSFTDGYDTVIEQGGTNVSGGQKQRLCIAAALLKRPKILILDDSTSAVDTATEARIRDTFRNDLPDSTKIIIAQRISSVIDADTIIVMNDGRITGTGTHRELIESNTEYREIYFSQVSENETAVKGGSRIEGKNS